MHLLKLVFIRSSGIYTRSWNTGSYVSSVFSFFEELPYYFHSGYTNLHSYQHSAGVPFSSHPCQYVLFIDFLMIGILTGVRWWSLIVVLICISLMISNLHIFSCTLDFCVSSLEKMSIKVFCPFLIIFFLNYRVVWVVYVFWEVIPYWPYNLKIFNLIQ